MATLTIELRNLCLLARYGDEVTAVFPREKHDLFVVYRQGGAWHERAIPPGADVRLLDGQAGATVNLDAGDRFIPHCDAIFGAPVRMAADLLRQPANPEVVGARLWLPSGSVAGAPGERFPGMANVEWEFRSNGHVHRHRVTDVVRQRADAVAGAHRIVIAQPDKQDEEIEFDVEGDSSFVAFINRDQCDPPPSSPRLELQDFEQLFRVAGLQPPFPIPTAESPADFTPDRFVLHARRPGLDSCDVVCGAVQIEVG